MSKTTCRSLLTALLLLCLQPVTVAAEEVIESFHSDIQVLPSGDMEVTETIVVFSEQEKIRRGIYRKFPTRYEDLAGNHYVVDFNVLGIERDGRSEKYRLEDRSNGVQVYIGDKNTVLPKGRHIFDIRYRTNRQLGFFDDHDELYWNVTGHDWAFPILTASARVLLPDGIPASAITLDGFTGPYGSRDKDFLADVAPNGVAYFETLSPLGLKEGLTVVVSWPKGFVTEPDLQTRLGYLLKDNAGILAGLVGLVLVIVYYLFIWQRVGRDPKKGVIIPHYEPPVGYSPASVRFIRKMGYDDTCFTAGLVNLAVKRYLTITEDDDNQYSLLKEEGTDAPLAAGEKTLLSRLFKNGSVLELKQANHRQLSAAKDAHVTSLQNDFEKIYFNTNRVYFVIGLALSLVVFVVAVLFQASSMANSAPQLFIMLWLSIWSIGVFTLVKRAWNAWKNVHTFSGVISAVFITAFAVPFIGAEVVVFGMFAQQTSWLFPLMIIVIIAINWLFYELLKAPTRAGRKLLDKIEGFKNYIEVAEKHDLQYKYAGGKTPELFERLLPYAIALGIEKTWGDQFEAELQQAADSSTAYLPAWYHGRHWNVHNVRGFTSAMGSSLSSAVASAATAPGSSSGSGGGGFSGGGGGGGGGGGW